MLPLAVSALPAFFAGVNLVDWLGRFIRNNILGHHVTYFLVNGEIQTDVQVNLKISGIGVHVPLGGCLKGNGLISFNNHIPDWSVKYSKDYKTLEITDSENGQVKLDWAMLKRFILGRSAEKLDTFRELLCKLQFEADCLRSSKDRMEIELLEGFIRNLGIEGLLPPEASGGTKTHYVRRLLEVLPQNDSRYAKYEEMARVV